MNLLSDIPAIDAIFIQADIEEVASYFRGHFQWINYADEAEGYLPARIFRIVRGAEAKIGEPIGHFAAAQHLKHEWARNHYAVWGYVRLARVTSNPRLVMVEYAHDWDNPLITPKLAEFTGAKTYEFQSWIGLDKRYAPLHLPEKRQVEESTFVHVYQFHGQPHRYLAAFQESNRYQFEENGTPCDFENLEYYKKRLVRDRLNRKIILEYMEKIGVDTEGVFLRGELEDPILFTGDVEGEDFSHLTGDLNRYLSIFPQKDYPRLVTKV